MRIGTDLVYVPRVPTSDTFVRGILSERELEEYRERKDKQRYLAGRFAAKEAYLKALGTGLGGKALKEIEVLHLESGAPYLQVGESRYDISISHDGDYAVAVCLLP